MKSLLFSLLVASGLSSLAGNAYAQSTVYTNQSSFLEQVQSGYYLEDFNKGAPGPLNSPVLFSQGEFSYQIDAPSKKVYYTRNNDVAISTIRDTNELIVTFTSNNITAIGGNFFLIDFVDAPADGTITVNLSDGTTQSFNSTTLNLPFRGFISKTPITSLTLPALPGSGRYVTIDNLIVGRSNASGTPVPAPSSAAVFFGLAGLGSAFLVRRRK